MNCDYHGKPIIDSVSGISTCNKLITASASITPSVDSSCCPHDCWATHSYDLIIKNDTASSLHLGHTYYTCMNILIIGTYTINEDVDIDDCNISLAPHAKINVTNNSIFNITDGFSCTGFNCPHIYAACDTMWRR